MMYFLLLLLLHEFCVHIYECKYVCIYIFVHIRISAFDFLLTFKVRRVAFRVHRIWTPSHRHMSVHWCPIRWRGWVVSVILYCRSFRAYRGVVLPEILNEKLLIKILRCVVRLPNFGATFSLPGNSKYITILN